MWEDKGPTLVESNAYLRATEIKLKLKCQSKKHFLFQLN